MSKKANYIKQNSAFWALLGLCGLVGQTHYSFADDAPFQMENGRWMSFDHYKDAEQRGKLDQPATSASDPVADGASAPAAQPASAVQTPAAQQAAIAAPARPIDLPIMPGVNKGFGVQVNSTEDSNKAELVIPAPDANGEAQPADLRLADKNWQTPAAMQNTTELDENGEPVDVPLNVRMSLLPDNSVRPNASPEHASALQASRAETRKLIERRLARQQRENAKDKMAATPAQTAAQAALDAYKKQQLDAIQSDRQTLKALQEAVHSLGLEKQLDFMAGAKGDINAQDTTQPQATVR